MSGGAVCGGVVRFAALGDSVTVGLGDPAPRGGFAGLLAEALAPPGRLEMRNFASCGALIQDVAADQLPRAVELRPTVASVLVGVNDTLRGEFELGRIAAGLEEIIEGLSRAGAVVLTASLPDPGLMLRIPKVVCRPLGRRIHAINTISGHLARRYGTVHVDLASHPALYDRAMWGVDRLHPSERGHRTLALLFAAALAEHGVPVGVLPDPRPSGPAPGVLRQAHWLATEGTGWLARRSRDLLPRLAQLVVLEWWHEINRRTAVLDARVRAQVDGVLTRSDELCSYSDGL